MIECGVRGGTKIYFTLVCTMDVVVSSLNNSDCDTDLEYDLPGLGWSLVFLGMVDRDSATLNRMV
jgi:hypothetical protein